MIMRGLISGLIRRVSAEHQLRNTTFGLRKFIDSANILTAAWAAGHEPSKGQVAYFNKRKGLFCKDTLGGIGIDQLRRVLIEPELDAMDAHADARSAVISTCDWLKKQGCSGTQPATFSDDQIRAMIHRSRRGILARFLGVCRG